MKTGFIIICRYSSTRLPGKILKEIAGKPIIEYILDRIKRVTTSEHIVIATSNEDSDLPIVNWCKTNNVEVYCGSLENVSKRFLDCAKAFEFDFAFRINGDNLFTDADLLREAYELSQLKQYSFISNVHQRTFPKGMSVEGVDVNLYATAYPDFTDNDKEHVMTYFYRHLNQFKYYFIYNTNHPEMAGLQLAIDTPEDFMLATKIAAHFTNEQADYGLAAMSRILKTLDLE